MQTESIKDTFSRNLKVCRSNLGLSQAKLAEKSQLSTSYIASIEAGIRFPSGKAIESIIKVLKVDAYLLFLPTTYKPSGVETMQILQVFADSIKSQIDKEIASRK